MTAQIIDGKQVAKRLREAMKTAVSTMKADHDYTPSLATVLVGEDAASATYVRMKHRACEEVGIRSVRHDLPADVSQDHLLQIVKSLGEDPAIDGILVQLPLPKHIDEEEILNTVPLSKDVDGFHPLNIGRLAMKGREPFFIPCTPHGCIVLMEEAGVDFNGAEAVVVGRSNIVGLPVAMLLNERNATVTICHSRTKDLAAHLKTADIVVAAVGRAEMITGDMLKPGAVVIDVGTNRVDDPSKKRGYRLTGDVDFESAKQVAGAITPVPGGVGPMTITMLLENTIRSAQTKLTA